MSTYIQLPSRPCPSISPCIENSQSDEDRKKKSVRKSKETNHPVCTRASASPLLYAPTCILSRDLLFSLRLSIFLRLCISCSSISSVYIRRNQSVYMHVNGVYLISTDFFPLEKITTQKGDVGNGSGFPSAIPSNISNSFVRRVPSPPGAPS